MVYYLGVDLGGTNIAVGLVTEEGRLVQKTSSPTPHLVAPDVLGAAIADVCKKLLNEAGLTLADIKGVGIGSPGQIDMEKGVVVFAGNLGLNNAPIADEVQKNLDGKIPVRMANDADAASWGEYMAGGAKGAKSAVAVTLGTGVGVGVILAGGKILPGEGGHSVLVYNGEYCTCGRHGCWEAYASATALIRQTKAAMQEHPDSKLWEACDKDIEKVNGRTVFKAMEMGDRLASAVFEQYVGYVAAGIVNIVNTLQPEVVCIGGGISGAGDVLLNPIREIVQKEQFPLPYGQKTRIELCKLGNDAGIIGAALLGK